MSAGLNRASSQQVPDGSIDTTDLMFDGSSLLQLTE
jgi:hypothetical protein